MRDKKGLGNGDSGRLIFNRDSGNYSEPVHFVACVAGSNPMKPSRDSVTNMALRTLEDALAQAECGPADLHWGQRLALIWLAHIGVAQKWQCETFWRALADPFDHAYHPNQVQYLRTNDLRAVLRNWYEVLGLEEPSIEIRLRLARRYAPDIDTDHGTQQHRCMCNRYQRGETQRVENIFGAKAMRAMNDGTKTVHPREPGLIVRMADGQRVVEQMTWGFPVVLRGKSGQPLKPKPVNNARFDKLGTFWKRWAVEPLNRCLIPTERYAEAVGTPGKMTETWLSVTDQPIFAWAGLWRSTDEWGNAYTGVMTGNAPELAHIHDRSPVILKPEEWETWLTAPLEELVQFDRPYPAQKMTIEATDTPWVKRL